ncbi:SHOCT domain-containing protein [Peterkaempfera griseoplana]|uniref:SHOCT domain-containing protein n=1 Tax=Peterkaempfera griseoplana TaxID=66896 RepID=UPI0006E2B323|nr:SHOCT domain-containing protein [Peterkaempfera griseoplana]
MDNYSPTQLAVDGNYPLLGLFLTMLWLFVWVLWFFLLFRVITDLFRDDSLSGWAKAAWMIAVIVLPYLGVLVYLIVRGRGMSSREQHAAREQQKAVDSYIRETAAAPSSADQLHKLSELKARGDLSAEEYERAKAKILA